MTLEPNDDMMKCGRFQFRLSTFLYVVTSLAGLMALGQWFGWWTLWGGLILLDSLGASMVTLLPVLVLVCRWRSDAQRRTAWAFVAAGTLLFVHLAVMAVSVESMVHEPLLLDLAPFDTVISSTLNWTVPSAVTAFLFALALHPETKSSLLFWSGAILTASSCFGLVWYAHYFFGRLLGISLTTIVWWL